MVLVCADMKRGGRAGVERLLLRRVGLRRGQGGAVFLATDTVLEFVELLDVVTGVGLFKCCATRAS